MDPDLVRQQEEAEAASRNRSSTGAANRPARSTQGEALSYPLREAREHPNEEAASAASMDKGGLREETTPAGIQAAAPRARRAHSRFLIMVGSLAGFAAGGVAGAVLGCNAAQTLALAGLAGLLFGGIMLAFSRRRESGDAMY
jgi:hypothetical protein